MKSKIESLIEKYVSLVDKIASYIPYNRILVWRQFFFNPVKIVSGNIDSITQRIIDIYAMQAILLVILLLAYLPVFFIAIGVVLLFFVIFLISPLFYLLWALFEFAIAKLLGGKANFTTHFNASILPTLSTFIMLLPLSLIRIPIEWFSVVPLINACTSIILLPFSIVEMLVGLYALYLKFMVFREVHKLDNVKSIAVVLIPIVVMIGIVIGILIMITVLFYIPFLGQQLGYYN